MLITGLYIVKNEEKEISRSILSIADICDEIVVIDTGSTDGTVAAVEALGAKVFTFEWCDDFAAARNYALSKAKGDLIIFLDADEWFVEPLGSEERKYLEQQHKIGARVFSVLRSNISDNVAHTPDYNTRMLRGKARIKYFGAIHESVDDTSKTVYLPERFLLYHSGYEGERAREKSERNLKILQKQFEETKDSGLKLSSSFYLARESRIIDKYEQAVQFLDIGFEIWKKMKTNMRPINVGICLYDLAGRVYSELDESVISNDKYFACCREFLRQFPKHPAAYFALATYYYTRHRNYPNALEAISKIEETKKTYRIEDYPHDYVRVDEVLSSGLMLRGNMLYDLRQRDKAFDCYADILKHSAPTPGFLRRLLNLIKNQPTEEIVSFLSAVPAKVDIKYIEMLLSQVIYFPELRDVYMFFAVEHLKQARTQSDITAIATLVSGEMTASVIETANAMLENDPLTANALYLLAALSFNDPSVIDKIADISHVGNLLECCFNGKPPEMMNKVELEIIGRAFPIVIFTSNEEMQNRLFMLIKKFNYVAAYMILSYCNRAEEYSRLLPHIDVDTEALSLDNKAAFLRLLGRAHIATGDYNTAAVHLKESFNLAPGENTTYKELGVLASVAPELAPDIYALITRFRNAEGLHYESGGGRI